jgi:hypothetical protein
MAGPNESRDALLGTWGRLSFATFSSNEELLTVLLENAK